MEEQGYEEAERSLLLEELTVHLHEQVEEHRHVADRVPLGVEEGVAVRPGSVLLGSRASRGLGLAGEREQRPSLVGFPLEAPRQVMYRAMLGPDLL